MHTIDGKLLNISYAPGKHVGGKLQIAFVDFDGNTKTLILEVGNHYETTGVQLVGG